MVPDLRIHGLEGRGSSYFELKLLRASRNTYPSGVRGGATGVEKLALAVNREHIGRLTDLDEQLYGVAVGPRQHGHSTRPPNPGPLVQAYSRHGGAAEQSTHAPTAAHGAATPSSTGARSRPGPPGREVLDLTVCYG